MKDGRHIAFATALLVLATILVYANSFSGPFVFDDQPSILGNASIEHLWALTTVLSPPADLTVGGRPLVNFSLALNYAISGTAVWSYHLVNLLIHVLAGLTLFGVIRRTLLRTPFAEMALPLAAASALVWLVHPLQTEAVTYVVQRAESLASLCYLLTLYCFIRSTDSPVTRRWSILAIIACVSGILCKEILVTAPFIVLLYDRTFVAGGFRSAWQRRKGFYLGLFSTLLVLGFLVAQQGRGVSAGFTSEVSVGPYALTQSRAVVHYLALIVWPHPLIFDYGVSTETDIATLAWRIALILCLVGATIVALVRWPALGFAGAAFFAILAPSSSIVPIATQTIAEHRMYLASSIVITLFVVGLYRVLGRPALAVCMAWVAVLGWTTFLRNQDYQDELTLWQDTANKLPSNARAQYSIGATLATLGKTAEAIPPIEEAIRLLPKYTRAHLELAKILAKVGRYEEASNHAEYALYDEAVRSHPNSPLAHDSLGVALARLNRFNEAAEEFTTAVTLEPGFSAAHNDLGKTMARLNKLQEAIAQFEAALRIDTTFEEAKHNLMLAQKQLKEKSD